jgi:poly-gamma-glutamate synthesis protein (capsule biosynthesis protein)
VDFACLANEDAAVLGQQGLDDTVAALDALGIGHVGNHKTTIFTTVDGLKIGIYAETAPRNAVDYADVFSALRSEGAELVVAMFHWGQEYDYLPGMDQEKLARAAIDAGADIVYGHHPKVLQLVENYKDGVILYSTGSFLSTEAQPAERDTAVFQMQVLRHADGTITVGSTTGEPWFITGDSAEETFQPRPVDQKREKDAAERIHQKQAGTYPEDRLMIEQTPTQTTEGTTPESSAATEGTVQPTESTPVETTTPATKQPDEE